MEWRFLSPTFTGNNDLFPVRRYEEVAKLAVHGRKRNNNDGFAISAGIDVPSGFAEFALYRTPLAGKRSLWPGRYSGWRGQQKGKNKNFHWREPLGKSLDARVKRRRGAAPA